MQPDPTTPTAATGARCALVLTALLAVTACAAPASAVYTGGDGEVVDCALNYSCTQNYVQVTTATCTQAFNVQINVVGSNTMECASNATSIAK